MFRPSFEPLEKREVLSSLPVAFPAADGSSKDVAYVVEAQVNGLAKITDGTSNTMMLRRQFAADDSRPEIVLSVAAGDVNGDGPLDLAIKSPRDNASGQATGLAAAGANVPYIYPELLPYIEQDNLFKLADAAVSDEAFMADLPWGDVDRQGIIAILIGLRSDPRPGPASQAAVTDLVIDPFGGSRFQDAAAPQGVLIGLLVP